MIRSVLVLTGLCLLTGCATVYPDVAGPALAGPPGADAALGEPGVVPGPGLNRRPGWERRPALFVNTGVVREPDYFESPFKDIRAVGGLEPDFFDLKRDVVATGYGMGRWAVNLAASPISAVVHPYWYWPLDPGPADPFEPPAVLRIEPVPPEPIPIDE
jgi:hypothetical protein